MNKFYKLLETFPWLSPWQLIENEESHLSWGRLLRELTRESIEVSLAEELKREVPYGHILYGLSFKAIAFCSLDPNEFIFVTNDSKKPIVCVHLTWSKETRPFWPMTEVYASSVKLYSQLVREHNSNIGQSK